MWYKDYSQSLGFSDIANLTLRVADKSIILQFGEDGEYKTYVIDQETEVPSHYHLVDEGSHWLKIYDDEKLVGYFVADDIKVYRAGERGCLIQLENCIEDDSDYCGKLKPFTFK